jgi:hypothetical protein
MEASSQNNPCFMQLTTQKKSGHNFLSFFITLVKENETSQQWSHFSSTKRKPEKGYWNETYTDSAAMRLGLQHPYHWILGSPPK